ncbi:MAG: DNA repair protein RecN [Hyphomicrobiales bacterium]
MLTGLSIRDIVLIEKLDLAFEDGLTVLTGETGAGKSILLDSLGLALGARGDSALVRAGSAKGSVTAMFSLPPAHPALQILDQLGLAPDDGDLVLRRVQGSDGSSRAFVNDQPIGVGLLRQVGGALVEIHGQHDSRALVEPANHRQLLDAFAGLDPQAKAVKRAFEAWQVADHAVTEYEEQLKRAETERAFIEHAAEELRALKPTVGEENALAERRQLMMNAEQFATAVDEARGVLSSDSLAGRLNAVLRKLERRREQAAGLLDEACSALDRLVNELNDAERALDTAQRAFAFNPMELEEAEERLFALRALARKHKVQVDDLAALLERFEGQLQSLDEGERRLAALEADRVAARDRLDVSARALSDARRAAARRLDQAVMAELGPLRLERARFETRIDTDAGAPSATGIDRVEFLVAANPGTPLAPLAKAASGGELSRFMLALKVVLAANGSAPTLIFDEIDTGMGGAVADAMGQRLARLAATLQVLAVTHSPQVASRAQSHYLIAKREEAREAGLRAVTHVAPLQGRTRREEIARMLSGSEVTEEARAQAERLLAAS